MGDFEMTDVLYFMISKGGRVTNHELVTHFKNVLNHPNNKVKNRNKFKDYVNELATIKLDGGEKVLVLKKKYRPQSDTFGSSTSVASSASSSSLSASSSLSSLSKSSSTSATAPTPATPEPDCGLRKKSGDGESLGRNSPMEGDEAPSPPAASPRAHSEPPPESPEQGDRVDGLSMSKVRSDENMEVTVQRTDRPAPRVEDSYSVSGSTVSLASTESQRSAGSSTSGIASLEDDPNASVISVKDKIKSLNKMHSETDVGQNRIPKKNVKHTAPRGDDDDDVSHSSGLSYVNLSAEQKEWMVVCASSEYHDMNRLLSKSQGLAKLKDFTNGYTALHWAAKSGKAEVIKLVASKPGVNVDQRSHGGYTALHLAALHGHEHIIELLVQTFKADADLRDYSGKKAKQYLMNSASSKAQRKRIRSIHGYSGLDIPGGSSHPTPATTQVKTKGGVRLSISEPIPMDSDSKA